MTKPPEMISPEPDSGQRLVRLAQEQAELLRQAEAQAIRAFCQWAISIRVHQTVAESFIRKLGVTEQEWNQALDEAFGSHPQVPPQIESLAALGEFLQQLSREQ